MKFQQNVGTADRLIRISFAIFLGALVFAGLVAAPLNYVAASLAAILFVTGATGFCPIYAVLRIRTCPVQRI